MKTIKLPPLRTRTITLAACGLILTGLIVTRSLAAYLADVAPEMALRLNPWQPRALVNLAERMLTPSPTPAAADADQSPPVANGIAASSPPPNNAFSAFELVGQRHTIDLPKVREWATAALMDEPLNAPALQILGQVADAGNDPADASIFMHAAAHLSLHETVAVYWLMARSADAKDYKSTIYYANAFMRVLPQLGQYVDPILARVAEDKAAAAMLERVLVDDPPWRDDFLQQLPLNVHDERAPLDLLLALRTSPQPPSSEDVNRYLSFLVVHKLYALAYYTWLQFLPPEQLRNAGFLYNGNFAVAPSGSPFDWVISQGSGVAIDIEPLPDGSGGHALVVNFEYGRVDFHSVTQLIMLAPGRYQFAGQYKGDLVGPRGLRWRVSCAENPANPIAQTDMIAGRSSDWSGSELDFTIPNQNCRAQYLSLELDARMPSEQFVTGSMWFDDLRISRLASTTDPVAESTTNP